MKVSFVKICVVVSFSILHFLVKHLDVFSVKDCNWFDFSIKVERLAVWVLFECFLSVPVVECEEAKAAADTVFALECRVFDRLALAALLTVVDELSECSRGLCLSLEHLGSVLVCRICRTLVKHHPSATEARVTAANDDNLFPLPT